MLEKKQDYSDSTKLYTEGGYEATEMIHPLTKEKLIIRESFSRKQLTEDGETEEEHKMRKKLLNAFKKATKRRALHIPAKYYDAYLKEQKETQK